MMTLVLSPRWPFNVTPLAPVSRNATGGGLVQARRRWSRPYYQFNLLCRFRSQAEANDFRAFQHYHQQDKAFWFHALKWSDIENPLLVEFADGARKDFFLPNANVFAPSLVVYVNGTVTTAWTVNEASGLVTFTSAPAANAEIKAKYRCKYKCVFWGDDTMTPQEERFDDLLDQQVIIREIP